MWSWITSNDEYLNKYHESFTKLVSYVNSEEFQNELARLYEMLLPYVEKDATAFYTADEFTKAQKIAGLVRIELGKRLDLIEKNVYKFCFIVDFPMYELTDE